MQSPQPILVTQKIVNFIRKDQLFEVNTVRAQPTNEVHGLRELDVPIIIAMYQ